MAVKCLVLIYYKNGRGYNFRRQVKWHSSLEIPIKMLRELQLSVLVVINFSFLVISSDYLYADSHLILKGQMLTLIEYTLLLYRAMLPTPVWYRFFLNKDNGSLFSSLTTGLYLTFKLTSVVEKVMQYPFVCVCAHAHLGFFFFYYYYLLLLMHETTMMHFLALKFIVCCL